MKTITDYQPSTAVRTLVTLAGSHAKAAADNQTPMIHGMFATMRDTAVSALRTVVLAEMDEIGCNGCTWDEQRAAASDWADQAIADYLAGH